MRVFCKKCKYRGFSESVFCTFEDRYVNTGEYRILKKDKNSDGFCRDFEPSWFARTIGGLFDEVPDEKGD